MPLNKEKYIKPKLYRLLYSEIYKKKTTSMQKDIHIFTKIGFSHFFIIYIYIVIHRQTCFVLSELFRVARQARFPKLGSEPAWFKLQAKILPLSHEENSASEENLNAYVSQLFLFTYVLFTTTESSIHMKSLALRWWQTIYFSRYIYIYIYIYLCVRVCVCCWLCSSVKGTPL